MIMSIINKSVMLYMLIFTCILNQHRVSSKITDMDAFEQNITFAYNGSNSFKTFIGGFVSLIIRLLILAIAIFVSITVIQRSNTSKLVTKTVK